MAGNRKPPRRRRAKPTFVPMMKSTHDDIALEMHLAVEALIGAPSPATYNQLSKMLRVMGDVGTTVPALAQANTAMLSVCDRYERVGKVGMSAAEAQSLRKAIALLDIELRTIPVNVFVAAVNGVAKMCEEMGA